MLVLILILLAGVYQATDWLVRAFVWAMSHSSVRKIRRAMARRLSKVARAMDPRGSVTVYFNDDFTAEEQERLFARISELLEEVAEERKAYRG